MNVNNTLSIIITVFSKTVEWAKWQKVLYLCKSLQYLTIEDSWTLISTFYINLLWYVILINVHEENPALHRYVVVKGRRILMAILGHCGYSFDTTPRLLESSFWKVGCNTELYQWKFYTLLYQNPSDYLALLNEFFFNPWISFDGQWFDLYFLRESKWKFLLSDNKKKGQYRKTGVA